MADKAAGDQNVSSEILNKMKCLLLFSSIRVAEIAKFLPRRGDGAACAALFGQIR